MLASVLLASSRWDFGLDNPNKAAAILAFLVLVLLSAAMRARCAWARWCCAALSLVAGYGLVRTFSRGGELFRTGERAEQRRACVVPRLGEA